MEDLQFRVEEACITKGDLEVNAPHRSTQLQLPHFIQFMFKEQTTDWCNGIKYVNHLLLLSHKQQVLQSTLIIVPY